MKCKICGKFMQFEKIIDFTSYYRCVDDCDGLVEDFNSEERNMRYADKINKTSVMEEGDDMKCNCQEILNSKQTSLWIPKLRHYTICNVIKRFYRLKNWLNKK